MYGKKRELYEVSKASKGKYRLDLHKTPITLETLSQTAEKCGFQDKFSGMIIPRNLSSCTRMVRELFMSKKNDRQEV